MGPGPIPGQGTRLHMLQLKIPHVATKAWHSQINKINKHLGKKVRSWLRELLVRERGYFRPDFGRGNKHRAGITATVYFQNSTCQYLKDPENKRSPISGE